MKTTAEKIMTWNCRDVRELKNLILQYEEECKKSGADPEQNGVDYTQLPASILTDEPQDTTCVWAWDNGGRYLVGSTPASAKIVSYADMIRCGKIKRSMHWERYNHTTGEIEEEAEIEYSDDCTCWSDCCREAIEYLIPENDDADQSGEWDETGYVYFRDGQTIEIR